MITRARGDGAASVIVSAAVNSRVYWLALPLLVALAFVMGHVQSARVATRDDWARATDAVRSQRTPTDALLWAPLSQGEGRLYFDGLNAQHAELPTADLARWDTLWVLGSHGRGAADLVWPHRIVETQTFGPLTVEKVRVEGERVVGDLLTDLERVRVSRVFAVGGEVRVCGFWSGRGWHCALRDSPERTRECLAAPTGQRLARRDKDPECGLDPLLHVSRDVRLIGDVPRRCLWVHPVANARVTLEWFDAPAGSALQLDYGFSDPMVADNYKRDRKVRAAHIRVTRTGRALLDFEVTPVKGWRSERVDLPPEAGPLTIEVSSDDPRDAHLCIDPTLRGPRQGEGSGP